MNILLTNDDGIDALGLQALIDELKEEHNLYVCAPHQQCSANSHHATYFFKDVYAEKKTIPGVKEAWAIEGTPADTVYLSIHGLLEDKIDMVISGINKGCNVSTDTIYSGTVAAAREAIIHHIPGIAISQNSFSSDDYKVTAEILHDLIPIYLQDPNCHEYLFNVNVPYLPKDQIKGIRVKPFEQPWAYDNESTIEVLSDTRICFRTKSDVERLNKGRFDLAGDATNMREGYVVITPIGLDSVDYKRLEELKKLETLSVK